GRQSISGFAGHLPPKTFNDSAQVLARKNGVVHDQIADRLTVFASFYWCKLLHIPLLIPFQFYRGIRRKFTNTQNGPPPTPAAFSSAHCACSVFPMASRSTIRMA